MLDIIDTGTAPEIYVDDIGAVDDLGVNCRVVYVTYVRAPGRQIFEPLAVVKLIRPKRSVVAGRIGILLASGPAAEGDREGNRLHS